MAVPYEQALAAYQRTAPGPVDPDKFNAFWSKIEHLSPEVFAAATEVLSKPDQAEAFARDYGGDIDRWLESVTSFWSANGLGQDVSQYGPEMKLIDALGYQVNPEALAANANANPLGTLDPNDPRAVALEQELMGRVLEYGNADMAGDAARRAEAEQIKGNVNRSIDEALKANAEINNPVFDSTGYLKANPDVAAWASQIVANGQVPDVATAAKLHYDNFGKNEGRAAPMATRLQLENYMATETNARLAGAAQAAATSKLASLDQRKAEMTAALNQMQGDRSGALDAQTAQLRQGLDQLEKERYAAMGELERARVAAAETEVTGINMGLQSERDRVTAEAAQQGFIGGSSMQDAALARATIGARQEAARSMGTAKVANATDKREIGDQVASARFGITGNDANTRFAIADDTARGRFSLADSLSQGRVGVQGNLAEQMQSAADTETKMRLGYFDNDYNRRMQSALVPISLESSRFNMVDAAGQLGQAGLKRTFDNLGWFSTPGYAPPQQTGFKYEPSQTGAGVAALGGALAGAGFSIGNAAGWGKTTPAKTTTPTPAFNYTAPQMGDHGYQG